MKRASHDRHQQPVQRRRLEVRPQQASIQVQTPSPPYAVKGTPPSFSNLQTLPKPEIESPLESVTKPRACVDPRTVNEHVRLLKHPLIPLITGQWYRFVDKDRQYALFWSRYPELFCDGKTFRDLQDVKGAVQLLGALIAMGSRDRLVPRDEYTCCVLKDNNTPYSALPDAFKALFDVFSESAFKMGRGGVAFVAPVQCPLFTPSMIDSRLADWQVFAQPASAGCLQSVGLQRPIEATTYCGTTASSPSLIVFEPSVQQAVSPPREAQDINVVAPTEAPPSFAQEAEAEQEIWESFLNADAWNRVDAPRESTAVEAATAPTTMAGRSNNNLG
ncbi:hypothetical protein [Hydrogenophaga sp.]|uniref:hypothetical protein n=1 Tax=Hydrogenophaga sp. TaxID=1904254 RepID=UPI0027247AD8|nr:hypothetical protein [Hydrogenophaga sp.]MDO9434269.1 hypothetical protein [Hydrogenophaga sp.]